MAGGGLTPLTADLVAAAIVAAARSYGDDPERAFTAKGGPIRRPMTPAAEALVVVTGVPFIKLSGILGIAPRGAARSRANGGLAYEAAFRAAEAAVRARVREAAAAAPPPPLAWPADLVVQATEVGARVVEAGGCAPPILVDAPALRPPTRTLTARAARREVATLLAVEPHSAGQLMEALRLGEGQVRDALRALADAGEVRCDPLTAEGWAKQTWRVAA